MSQPEGGDNDGVVGITLLSTVILYVVLNTIQAADLHRSLQWVSGKPKYRIVANREQRTAANSE